MQRRTDIRGYVYATTEVEPTKRGERKTRNESELEAKVNIGKNMHDISALI